MREISVPVGLSRKTRDLDRIYRNVKEFICFVEYKVMVRLSICIKMGARTNYWNLVQKSGFGEIVQGVVDCRKRHSQLHVDCLFEKTLAVTCRFPLLNNSRASAIRCRVRRNLALCSFALRSRKPADRLSPMFFWRLAKLKRPSFNNLTFDTPARPRFPAIADSLKAQTEHRARQEQMKREELNPQAPEQLCSRVGELDQSEQILVEATQPVYIWRQEADIDHSTHSELPASRVIKEACGF